MNQNLLDNAWQAAVENHAVADRLREDGLRFLAESEKAMEAAIGLGDTVGSMTEMSAAALQEAEGRTRLDEAASQKAAGFLQFWHVVGSELGPDAGVTRTEAADGSPIFTLATGEIFKF